MRSKFVQDCIKNSGISDTLANKIFSDIEYFGGYGFNRAHAASYAMISYITAYLKTNYTVEYMAALMSSVVGNKDKQSLYLADCRKLGVNVMPPSINYSGIDFEVLDSNSIIFGLSAINGIGNSIAENIVSIRDQSKPYTNMHDFFRRCGATLLKKSTLEHLAKAGALDELFNIEDNELNRIQEIKLLEIEKEELGIYVTDHPVNGIWDILSKKIDYEIFDLSELSNNTQVKIGGILSDVKPMVTKKGMKMYKLILEDISSDIEIIVFPKSLKNLGETPFSKGDILIVNGSVNKEGDEENSIVKLYYNSSEKVDSKIFSSGKAIILEIDENFSPSLIEKIYGIIESTKGDKPVFMQMTNGNHKYIFKFKNNTSSKVQSVIENIIRMEKENV